jgi:hypothetical protein
MIDPITNYFLQLGIMAGLFWFAGFILGRYTFPAKHKNTVIPTARSPTPMGN